MTAQFKKSTGVLIQIFFYLLTPLMIPLNAIAESTVEPKNSPGVVIKVPALPESSEFFLGGLLQTEYLYYTESEREDNRFHIRRARVELTGQFTEWLKVDIIFWTHTVKSLLMISLSALENLKNPSALNCKAENQRSVLLNVPSVIPFCPHGEWEPVIPEP